MNRSAIIMAAGLGERMRPLTENTPKPLIKAKGRPLIETVIEGLHSGGVEDIHVVTGYLGEQFIPLEKKYPGLSVLENKEYRTKNNISSIYAAKDYLGSSDVFICEADLYVSDPLIFKADLSGSCYYGRMTEGYSDDWVFDTGPDGFITRVGKGGRDCYNMVGVSFFLKDDAAVLKQAIEEAYGEPGHEQLFWDDVVNINLDRLRLKVHAVSPGQLVELDTAAELEAFEKGESDEG